MDLLWACELEHLRSYCDRVLGASKETHQAAAIFFSNNPEEKRQILSVDGETATIDIRGTLTNRPSLIGSFFNFRYTSYIDIQEAIETIAADDTIKRVRLVVDSPGGSVTGVDETWMAIHELAKTREVIAENHGLMASAAYWIATAAGKIVATSPSAETGSIGVYMLYTDYTQYDAEKGIKDIRIVSKNAPLKNPNPATAEGFKAYQERLDALERVFIGRVAEGRRATVEKVEKNFGRGAVLVAQDPDPEQTSALSVGMIDEVIGAISAGSDRKKKAEDPTLEPGAGSPPFKDFPIVDKPWDASAAIRRVRSKTGSTEKPSASYKSAFFWYDPADEKEFGAYKLPFVDVVDGSLKAIRRGIFAAKGAMAGARGQKPAIPAGDVAAVNSHIDKYVKKIEKEDKEKNSTASTAATGRIQNMKYADLKDTDPELLAEVDGLIVAARADGSAESKKLIDAIAPVLAGDEPQPIKDLAIKVLKGEATEDELKGARTAYAAMAEELAATAAADETSNQEPTPATAPELGVKNGEIKSEEDHREQVARFRASRGQEN